MDTINRHVYEYIERAVSSDRIPHAILISGTDEPEKDSISKLLATSIVCTGERRPCDACPACRKAKADAHPDIITPVFEKASIGVDEIRDIKSDSMIVPNDGQKKVYIIKNADKMTPSAQNAFLKILEEPTTFTTFILLCCNHGSFLPTVLSRVVHLKLSAPGESTAEVSEEVSEIAQAVVSAILKRSELEILKAFNLCEKRKRDEMSAILAHTALLLRKAVGSKEQGAPRECEFVKIYEVCESARKMTMQNVGVNHIAAMCAVKIAMLLE